MNILQINFLMFFVCSLVFLNSFFGNKLRNIFLFFITIQLSVVSGLRSQWVGVDSNRYARHFENVANIDSLKGLFQYDQEVGYVIYQKIISIFSEQYAVLFFLTSLMIFTILAWFVKQYSNNYFLSYLIFISLGFFEFTMSGIRQSIAISVGLIAFHFALERKPIKFLIIVLLAVSFHSSSIILFLFYPLANLNITNIKLVFVSLIYILTYFFRYRIGEMLTLFYYDDEASTILHRYSTSSGLGTLTIFMIILVIAGYTLSNPNRDDLEITYKATFSTTIISIFFQTLSSFSYLFTRLNMYYMLLLIVFIPNFLTNISTNRNQNTLSSYVLNQFILIVIVVALTIYYLTGVNNNINNLLPYKFYWEL